MRFSSIWPLIPVALGLATVFYLPSGADRAAVDEIRADIRHAVATISNALTGGAGTPQRTSMLAAADSSEPSDHPTMHYNKPVASARGDSKVRQTWENRPGTSDYSNGRNTRSTYGESQRGATERRR